MPSLTPQIPPPAEVVRAAVIIHREYSARGTTPGGSGGAAHRVQRAAGGPGHFRGGLRWRSRVVRSG